MNINDFKSDFIRENQKLKVLIGVSWVIFCGIFLLLAFDKKYFVYQGHPILKERVLSEAVCLNGFRSIVRGEPDSSIVSQGILSILKQDPFIVEIDEIVALKSIDKGYCKLILKNKTGLRAFKIGLSEDDSNAFYYMVLSIDEVSIKES